MEKFDQQSIAQYVREHGILILVCPDGHNWDILNSRGQTVGRVVDGLGAVDQLCREGGYRMSNFYNRGQKTPWNPVEGDQVYVLELPWRKKNEKGEWVLLRPARKC